MQNYKSEFPKPELLQGFCGQVEKCSTVCPLFGDSQCTKHTANILNVTVKKSASTI